jgi:peroxiredoxin
LLAVILKLSPSVPKALRNLNNEHQMPFTGIADPEHIIAKMYGQQVKLIKLGRMPASLLIDKMGQIRYTHFGESMADIPESQQILSLIDDMNKEDAGKRG